uniref:Glycoside hydrolase family 65 central catalytic domain-containing protein n=1 Tax=Anopheles maculatus TaxID=74869 RepID=A0A182TBK2_9DIPT
MHSIDFRLRFSTVLNDPWKPLPTLANGHLGFTVFEDTVYMAGLYNGAGGLSHRARIPNIANIQLDNDCYRGTDHTCIVTLDLRSGYFRVSYTDSERSFRMTHIVYPHAFYRRLIVNQFLFERLTPAAGDISLPLRPGTAFTSEDIHFEPPTTHASARVHSSSPSSGADGMNYIHRSCGTTLVVENATYQSQGTPVCVLWNHVPERLMLSENEQTTKFHFLMAVGENVAIAEKELTTALAQTVEELLLAHTSLWHSFWDRFDILMTGNEPLQTTVRSSVFYLVSNLPFEASFIISPGPFWGLSPTGLGRGGTNLDDYEGHSFWDTEIWMFPVLNLIDPWYSRLLISYRTKMLPTAKQLAAESGYEGVRQYLATTHDLEWLQKRGGCGMIQLIADFWSSRVRFNYTGTENYDIPAAMGPDEDHENVTNNAYTNVVAGYALYFGDFVSCICGDDVTAKNWTRIARQIKLLYDEIGDFHIQYEGYLASTKIKQADAVLLGYPLLYPVMRPYTLWNDLRIYEPVTRSTGPAMSWSMYAINHLDIVNYRDAATNFNRSYLPYTRGPFHVWHELQQPGPGGAQNFITGAGGFLQAVLFGYAGFRVYLDRLEIRGIYPLELSVAGIGVTAKGVQYLGALIVVTQTVDKAEIIVTHLEHELTIEFSDRNAAAAVVLNCVYPLRGGVKAIIRAKSYPYGECAIPKDVIGE